MLSKLVLSALLTARSPAAQEPLLLFDEKGLEVSGLEPGSEIAFFGALKHPVPFQSRIEKSFGVAHDDDLDGVVRWDVAAGVPGTSVWMVADLKSGDYWLVRPSGKEVDVIEPKPGDLKDLGDEALGLTLGIKNAWLLVLRKDGKAWELLAYDGGEHDLDGEPNGVIEGDLGKAKKKDAADGVDEPLLAIEPQDILIAFDPISLEVVAAKGAHLLGGQP